MSQEHHQTPPPQGQEKRLTFRLLSYWNRIRGDRDMPAMKDVDIGEILEMWHFCFVIRLEKDVEQSAFDYFGPELATIFNQNYGGELLVDALRDTMLDQTIGFYEKVVERRAPVSESSEFVLDDGEVRYRSLIVPMSGGGNTVDFLLGTTNYKIFPIEG